MCDANLLVRDTPFPRDLAYSVVDVVASRTIIVSF